MTSKIVTVGSLTFCPAGRLLSRIRVRLRVTRPETTLGYQRARKRQQLHGELPVHMLGGLKSMPL